MKTNLRPCPFCGKKRHLRFEPFEGSTDTGIVVCICGASYTTIEQGADWNTRPIEDGLQAEIEALQQELDELKELTRWHNGDFENPTKEGEYNVFVSCANGDDPFYSVDKWSDNRGWSNFGWHKSDSDPDFELPQFFVAAWSSFHEIDIDLEQGE